MRNTQHTSCNAVLGAPVGHDHKDVPVGALAITRSMNEGVATVSSFWKPNADELKALNSGKSVIVTIMGYTHAPISVSVAATE